MINFGMKVSHVIKRSKCKSTFYSLSFFFSFFGGAGGVQVYEFMKLLQNILT